MKIRPATLDDKELLLAMWSAFDAEMPDHPALAESEEQAWADLKDHVEHGVSLVAEEDGKPIGFAFTGIGRLNPGVAHLTDLYVVRGARGRGVGTKLIEEVERRVRERDIEHLSLNVLVTNTRARKLYERLGFESHELFMIKSLGG